MAQTLDLYLDISSGSLVSGGSVYSGVFPTLTRNDSYNFRVRLLERDYIGSLVDYAGAAPSIKLGIGNLAAKPSTGSFRLTLSGPVTSSAIAYNAAALDVYNAISGIAGSACTVTTYGSESNAWIITAATANTAMTWGGDSYTLFPASSVLISPRQSPDANTKAQYVVQLSRNPAVLATTFSASATAGVISLTKVQDGDAGTAKNESYVLNVGRDAVGGSVVLAFAGNSTTGIPVGASAASFTEALSAVTGIGSGNVSVETGNNFGSYNIIFTRALGQQDLASALTLDASGAYYGRFFEATVTMGTAELDELFAEAGANTITPKIEVEINDGSPRTIFQGDVTVRRDLISQSAAIPAARESYYTKSEIDAFSYLKNSVTAFSSTASTATLYAPSGSARVQANNTGLGFYGSTPVAQPSGANAVSGLISLGLLASSATYGVLPQSIRTVTTSTTVTIGFVDTQDQTSVTVSLTGAAVNDLVLLGLPSSVCSGLVLQGSISSSGVAKITALNVTASGVTQSMQTFRITAIGY